ncbi:HD domain-containing protein [uncultured Hymenobacter sp.]|uniref:HD domain-containing protein n=1 Tax=uncultured Hymenobacter sp. TaxID=170016 RepID=UPI0035CACBC9
MSLLPLPIAAAADPAPALITQTAAFIADKFAHEGSGHDWAHIRRVWQVSRALAAQTPGTDALVVELGALLHDVADWKFHQGDEEAGPRAARQWLAGQSAPEDLIQHVERIIREISFKGLGVPTPMSSLEGQLVQDADRLDAIGAIGVARAFAYGGHKGRLLHDPTVAPIAHATFAAYKQNTAPTLNHFYEKLLHLRERLHTSAARRVAEERHAFMEAFVAQFLREWEGEDLLQAGMKNFE